METQDIKVEIFSTPTCTFCDKAKDLLTRRGLEFIEHNVKENEVARERMVRLSNQMGVPVILIDDIVVAGYDELEKVLEIQEEE